MLAFLARRLLWLPVVLLLVMVVTFFLMRGIGGSPFRLESGGLPLSLQVQLTSFYGLDDPWYVEFGNYARHVVTLDFGPSLVLRDTTVSDVIEQQIPVSLQLVALTALFAIPLGFLLGIVGALYRRRLADTIVTSVSTVLLVVPVFLFSELFSQLFIGEWGLVQAGWGDLGDKLVPAFVLALAPIGYVARVVRAGVVEALDQDYVRTARAKGLRLGRIVGVHVLRNSLTPFLAAAVPTLALVIVGAFFVEEAFGIPGAAGTFVFAAETRDYPMVMGLTVVVATFVVLMNLVADVVAVWLDPRLRERHR